MLKWNKLGWMMWLNERLFWISECYLISQKEKIAAANWIKNKLINETNLVNFIKPQFHQSFNLWNLAGLIEIIIITVRLHSCRFHSSLIWFNELNFNKSNWIEIAAWNIGTIHLWIVGFIVDFLKLIQTEFTAPKRSSVWNQWNQQINQSTNSLLFHYWLPFRLSLIN